MCLIGFLKTFAVKMKIENNQKMKTINIHFQCFQFKRNLISRKMKLR